MFELFLIYFKLTKIDSAKINYWTSKTKINAIQTALKKYDHKVRKEILIALSRNKAITIRLVADLIRIVKFDFIENSMIAREALNSTLSMKNNKWISDIEKVNKYLADRIRKEKNRNDFRTSFKIKSKGRAVFDKTDMVRLNQVKQGLKKSLRLW